MEGLPHLRLLALSELLDEVLGLPDGDAVVQVAHQHVDPPVSRVGLDEVRLLARVRLDEEAEHLLEILTRTGHPLALLVREEVDRRLTGSESRIVHAG